MQGLKWGPLTPTYRKECSLPPWCGKEPLGEAVALLSRTGEQAGQTNPWNTAKHRVFATHVFSTSLKLSPSRLSFPLSNQHDHTQLPLQVPKTTYCTLHANTRICGHKSDYLALGRHACRLRWLPKCRGRLSKGCGQGATAATRRLQTAQCGIARGAPFHNADKRWVLPWNLPACKALPQKPLCFSLVCSIVLSIGGLGSLHPSLCVLTFVLHFGLWAQTCVSQKKQAPHLVCSGAYLFFFC